MNHLQLQTILEKMPHFVAVFDLLTPITQVVEAPHGEKPVSVTFHRGRKVYSNGTSSSIFRSLETHEIVYIDNAHEKLSFIGYHLAQ